MTRTIHIAMDEEMAAEIENRANAMNLSADKYIQLVLLDSVDNSEPELLLQGQ